MAKVTVNPVVSLENQTTFLQTVNDNFTAIAEALETFLSRDGTTPNEMLASLDLNSQRLLNLPSPVSATDPVRLTDLQDAQALDVSVVPSLVGNENKLMSTDGLVLTWVSAGGIPGLGDMISTNNLSEITDDAAARTNLGLGTAGTYNIGTNGNNVPTLNGSNVWGNNHIFEEPVLFRGAIELAQSGDHRLTGTPAALTPESLGYRGAPTATQDTDYTFVLADAGRLKIHTSGSGHTYTIPTNATVAFPNGTVILIRNSGAGSVTVARSGGVALRKAGVSTDANATVAQWGYVSLLKEDTDSWLIVGTGVT